MTRGIFFAVFLGAVAASTVACGDDDDGDDDGGSTGGTGGTGGGQVECTPGGGGACQNEMDCPSVVSGEARSSSETCGLACLQDADPGTCTVTCIIMDTGMSQGCSVCYATLVGCVADNCLAECGTDPTSAECEQCQIDSNCRSSFDDCSGLDSTP